MSNYDELQRFIDRVLTRAQMDNAPIRKLGEYVGELDQRRGVNATQAILLAQSEPIRDLLDLLLVQVDPAASPLAVYVLFGSKPDGARVGFTAEDLDRVRAAFRTNVIPLSPMTFSITHAGEFADTPVTDDPTV